MNLTPLSQRDDRWKNIKLGFSSNTTIGSHGCTITCIAMWLSYYYKKNITPVQVNERLKEVDGFANYNLVIWSKLKEAFPGVEFEWRGKSYDNSVVSDNLPCLVEVDGTRIGGTKHWVLYVGDKKMADPFYGNIKDTNYYTPTGYAVLKFNGVPEEIEDTTYKWLESLANENNVKPENIEGWIRECIDKAKKQEADRQLLISCETIKKDMEKDAVALAKTLNERNEEVLKLTTDLESADKQIKVLKGEIEGMYTEEELAQETRGLAENYELLLKDFQDLLKENEELTKNITKDDTPTTTVTVNNKPSILQLIINWLKGGD